MNDGGTTARRHSCIRSFCCHSCRHGQSLVPSTQAARGDYWTDRRRNDVRILPPGEFQSAIQDQVETGFLEGFTIYFWPYGHDATAPATGGSSRLRLRSSATAIRPRNAQPLVTSGQHPKKQAVGRALFRTSWCCRCACGGQSPEGLHFLVPATQRRCVEGATISRIHTLAPHLGFGHRIHHQKRPVAASFPVEEINPAIAAVSLTLPLPSEFNPSH